MFKIYLYILCFFVFLFVSNKRLNGLSDPAKICCETSHDLRKGLYMIEI